tara:strand:- start:197 stop:307 length:111 start_codon:yes stop_codon:yes gene_type:complete
MCSFKNIIHSRLVNGEVISSYWIGMTEEGASIWEEA